MTTEDKELLLRDLCARLPYETIVRNYATDEDDVLTYSLLDDFEIVGLEHIKPYLRPMSSMTEEEKEELKQEHVKDEKLYAECLTKAANGDNSMRGKVIPHFAADWCNKNHFDYRGLIPLGLALETTKEMYG